MRQQAARQIRQLYLSRAQWIGSLQFPCFAEENMGTKLFKAIQWVSGRARTSFLKASDLYK